MRSALHIAYVCADRGVPIGGRKGASAHVWELSRALVRCGAEVRIAAARTNDALDPHTCAAAVMDLGADRTSRLLRRDVFATARTARQQAQAGEAYGLLFNQILGKTLERWHRSWHIDAIYERYSLWSHAAAAFAGTADIPYLLEVNA